MQVVAFFHPSLLSLLYHISHLSLLTHPTLPHSHTRTRHTTLGRYTGAEGDAERTVGRTCVRCSASLGQTCNVCSDFSTCTSCAYPMYLLADKTACTKVCPRSFISVNSLNAPLPQWDGVCSAIKCSEVMAGCEQCDTVSSCTQVRLLLPK